MARRKVIENVTQTTGSISAAAQGASITIGNAETISAVVTTTGTGTGSVQWQVSNDDTNWADYGSATTISGAGTVLAEITSLTALYARLSYTVTGSYSATSVIVLKGE